LAFHFAFLGPGNIILPFPSLENTHFGLIVWAGLVAFQQVLFYFSDDFSNPNRNARYGDFQQQTSERFFLSFTF